MTKREKIEEDLLQHLEESGTHGSHFKDLVDTYLKFWDTVQQLTAEIEDRGVVVEYKNGENQYGVKKNDAVAERNKTVNQMLKILNEIGVKPSEKEGDGLPPKL